MMELKQTAIVRQNGVLQVRSPRLKRGARVRVTVEPVKARQGAASARPWQAPLRKLSAAERRRADARLLKYFGSINSGDPRSADNDKIDRDLAREYSSTHEDAD